jgi:type I restriction enzyme, S subunit
VTNAAHGTKRLSQDDLDGFELPIPPLAEQLAIAKVLDLARTALDVEDRSFQRTQVLKRAVMRDLFTRGLRGEAQKESEEGPLPRNWQVSTLSSVAALERGRFLHRPRNEPRFYGGATPFVQTGDVVRSSGRIREFTQTLNQDGVAISRVFPAGTILITIAANIGHTGVLEFDSACPDSLVAIMPSAGIDPMFLNCFLQTQQSEMDRLAPKGTQKNINIQFLNPWPVVVPPFDEQREIVAILDAIDKKIDLHKRKRAVLEELFQTLLRKLMTGEIRVSNLSLSTLEVPAADAVSA